MAEINEKGEVKGEITVEMKDQVAHLDEHEPPGPWNMCFHWLKPRCVCTLVPDHTGDHLYSQFTITEEK